MITNSNRSSSDRTTQLRRRLGWASYSSGRPLNTYSATQESYISSVIGGRIAAQDAGCCKAAIDDDIYVVGRYSGNPLNFYNSNDMLDISMSPITSSFTSLYLVKYNKLGQSQWAAKMGIPSNSSFLPSLIADTNSDIYVTWLQDGSQLELYNASSSSPDISITLSNIGRKIVLAKYSTGGTAQWATYMRSNNFSGGGTFIDPPCVTFDKDHNVYMSADYDASGGLFIYQSGDPATPVKIYSSTETGYDSILIKYNLNGKFLWSSKVGSTSTSTELSYAIACDKNNNIFMAGSFVSNPLFIYNSDNTLSSITIQNSGNYDSYLIKFNSAGFAQWGTHIGGTSTDVKESICIDSDGDIYIAGCYALNPINIYSYNITSPTFTIPNTAFYDTYLVKYDTNGVAQWVTKIGGEQREFFPSITCDVNKNIILTGIVRILSEVPSSAPILCYSSTDLVTSALTITPTVLMTNSNSCVFLVSYNTNGILNWGTRIENMGISLIYPRITVDQTGNIYVTSEFAANKTIQIYDAGRDDQYRTLTGGTSDSSNFIVKYSNTGISSWVARIGQYAYLPSISTPFKAAF